MENLIGGMRTPIIGATEPPSRAYVKCTITVVQLNDSIIALPGQPPPPVVPKDQRFLAMYPMPSPQGFQMLVVSGATKENAVKGITQALQQTLAQNHLLGMEEVEVEL